MAQQHHRIYTFDLLRGIAVLTMMLAHSVYFFHNRGNAFLLSVEGFGNTVSFVTFLLVSGAVASIAYLHGDPDGAQRRKRALKRVLVLIVAYYVLALSLIGSDVLRAEGFARLRLVLNVLTFRNLPGFTEYFPPFIFFSALLAVAPRFFTAASRNLRTIVGVSIVSILAGYALYRLPVGSILQPWTALLAGASGLYRFPLLQYLPVFLLGLYWGKRTVESRGVQEAGRRCLQLFWFFTVLASAALLGSYALGFSLQTTFSRWPPSVPFLALGLSFAFLVASVLYALHQLRRSVLIRDLLLVFGQNALGIFWSHIFLLGLYASAGGPHSSSPITYGFLFILLVLLSLALTTFLPFNFRLALTSIRGSKEEQENALGDQAVFRLSKDVTAEAGGIRNYFFPRRGTTSKRILRKRHKLAITLVALAVGALVFPATTEEISLQHQQRNAAVWWSDAYAYRKPVTLKNPEPLITLQPGTPALLPFNHRALVDEGKSRADGLDVKLVYWSGNEHLVTESYVENPNSDQAVLKFQIPASLNGGSQDSFYYLYYGGFTVSRAPTTVLDAHTTMLASFGAEESYPLVASVSKRWSLIGEPGNGTVAFHLRSAQGGENQSVTYEVLGTTLTGSMNRSAETWDAMVPINTLRPGAYRIQATVHDGEKEQKSQVTGFYRSYPLYVAWTVDWEGYDVNPEYLDAMESIANQYHLPITHFFNPRIYVTKTISAARAQSLTSWVQRRIAMGDAYGLHLHMFMDFVESAGVPPKLEPNWGDSGNGYGVPLTAYSKAEQRRLIEYAQNLLVSNGFGRTNLFRAGGWFNNLDTFAALEDLGFRVDSSARTAYNFGRNRLRGNWNILPTAEPFRPSRTNQNVAASTNAFPILEIPDNGADSYAYSAQEMIDRFTANLGSGTLTDKQQVTFLSHPHWFDEKEQARMRQLFSYIGQYTFSDDRGPVIFTTTPAIAEIWNYGQ